MLQTKHSHFINENCIKFAKGSVLVNVNELLLESYLNSDQLMEGCVVSSIGKWKAAYTVSV